MPSLLSISNNSSFVPNKSSSAKILSSSSKDSDFDYNYTVSRQNIYGYYDYTKILIILFIIMFVIYLIVVLNKFN